MIRKLLLPIAVLAVALLSTTRAHADSLADRVPADAIFFATWAGSDSPGDKYNTSHLKALFDTFNIPALISQRMADDLQKSAADPQKQADAKLGQAILTAVLKAPTALYFGPIDFSNADQPQPKIAIFSKIGKDQAAAFAPQINAATARHKKPNDPPSTASAAGDFLLLTIGDLPNFDQRLSGAAPAENLANVPAFKAALTHVDAAAPAALLYLDAPAALKLIDDAIDAKANQRNRDNWHKAEDALGLAGLRQCAFAGNFDGPNWTSQLFIGLPAKRTGLLALLDSKPLPDDAFKLIPASATWAGVARFDGTRLLQEARDAAQRLDPDNGPQHIDAGLKQFFAVTGVDLEKDLFNSLGDSYVYYGTPDAQGHSFKTAILASKLKDPTNAETAIANIESMVSMMMQQRDPNGPVTFKTDPLPAPNQNVTVHVISAPNLSPTWTVADGKLLVSPSTAGIEAALTNAAAAGKTSILDNPQFAELFKKIGNKNISSFTFIDLPKVAAEAYPWLAQTLARRQVTHPDEKNPFVLPPLQKITHDLTPTLSVYWSDKDGYHAKSTGPIPLSEALNPPTLMLQILAARSRAARQPAPEPVPPERTPVP